MINDEILYGKIYPWLTANDNFSAQIKVMKDHLGRQKDTWDSMVGNFEEMEPQDNKELDPLAIKCKMCTMLLDMALESVKDLDDTLCTIRHCYSEVYNTFTKQKE